MDELGVNLAGVEVILNMSRHIEDLQGRLDALQSEAEAEITELRRRIKELEGGQRITESSRSSAESDGRVRGAKTPQFDGRESDNGRKGIAVPGRVQRRTTRAELVPGYQPSPPIQRRRQALVSRAHQELAPRSGSYHRKIGKYLDFEYDWQSRGLAVFASGKELWKVIPLPIAVRTQAVWANRPYVRVLSDVLDRFGAYAVALFDQRSLRLFAVAGGKIQAATESFAGGTQTT
jgi:hypothetical protein